MSNWTPDQYRDWMTRRLASEQRARERMQNHAKNHNPSQGLPATVHESDSGQALVGLARRKAHSGPRALQRAKITYIVRALRPCDYDNWHIKFLQDCLIASGILDDDNWQVLQGTVVSEKAESAEDEGTTVVIEQL